MPTILALVVPHTFRFIGLSFPVPVVVSPSPPQAFADPAAYGDLAAALLAQQCGVGRSALSVANARRRLWKP
jgi:hypothetical protein